MTDQSGQEIYDALAAEYDALIAALMSGQEFLD